MCEVISKLREALMLNDPEGEPGKSVLDMQSQQFVEAMQSLILVMEQLGWRAGAELRLTWHWKVAHNRSAAICGCILVLFP